MVRLIVLCLSLLGLSILLSSAVLTFLSAGDEVKTQSLDEEAVQHEAKSLQEQAESLSRRALPKANGISNLPTTISIDSTSISKSVSNAIDLQVSTRLGEFLDSLAGSDQRHAIVRQALTKAYADAAGLAATASPMNEFGHDSNFIINSLATELDSNELTQLETYLEDASRQEFLHNYSPQLDLVSPQLEAANKTFLLETLFTETYAATNPDGNPAGQTTDYLTSQLDAIRLTRESIRGALSEAQLELANDFLDEQEAGLSMALEIFGTTPQ